MRSEHCNVTEHIWALCDASASRAQLAGARRTSWRCRQGRRWRRSRPSRSAGRPRPARARSPAPPTCARTALRAHACTHANSSLPAPKSSPHVAGSTPGAGSKGALFGGAVPVAHALLHDLMTCAGGLRMHMRARGTPARATAAPAPPTRAAASARRARRAARPTPPLSARRRSWRAAPGPPVGRPRTNRRHDCCWDQGAAEHGGPGGHGWGPTAAAPGPWWGALAWSELRARESERVAGAVL